MKQRYYLSMLSLCLLLLLFDVIYIMAHKTIALFLFFSIVHVVMFGCVNFLGAWFLYKPIGQAFRQGEVTQAAGKRIRQLTWYSTGWVFLLGVLCFGTAIISLLFFSVNSGEVVLEKMPSNLGLVEFPYTLYIFAVLPAFIAYFLINDFTLDLRAKLFSEYNFSYPAGKKRLVWMLLLTFFIIGFLPSVFSTLELIVSGAGNEYAEFSAMTPLEAILPDRIVEVIAMIFAVVFISRSFTKPVYSLLAAINNVKEGNFDARAAVVTEDEIGVLTHEFNEMVKGLKEREVIRDTFGKYVTKDIATAILGQQINVTGQIRPCTILMTDIANYSTFSESLSPEEVVKVMNEYFSVVVNIIQRHKGVVNKFMGDAVLAVFNVPLDDPGHAVNAIRAALEIDKVTATQNFGRGGRLVTRIGINTGTVVAGNIGSPDRMEYTVIGDDVNIAARLEQLNKQYETRILVGENTYEMAKDDFSFTQLGAFQLKGKQRSVRVFKVESSF
jgi:class 3 adenylate cyclase